MTPVYATSSDYANRGYGTPPANVDQLLKAASRFVQRATMADVYTTDSDGKPLDPVTLDAFAEATCCHAAAMAALGIDPTTGGVTTTRTINSKSVDGASVTYANAVDAENARSLAANQLVPEARAILQDAGYATTRVWSWG